MHCKLHFAANRGCTVDSDRQLKKINAISFDEISMVGSRVFSFLKSRLQEMMETKELFGGIILLTVGDLFQLKPSFDKWIFENSAIGCNALASTTMAP